MTVLRILLWCLVALAVRPAAAAAPVYVGSRACAGCHEEEQRRWNGSDHDLAMQEADDRTVLGDFADASFTHDGTLTRFLTRHGRYLIRAEDADGVVRDHQVRYTFGVEPLQQYLLALPGGRLQAYDVAWDSRARSEGGQRWFALHPGEHIGPGDVLHWTGPAESWNQQCADCHSTDVRQSYDPATRRYDVAWSEIDVACEVCHGPGSDHLGWAMLPPEARGHAPRAGLVATLPHSDPDAWVMDDTGIARRRRPRTSEADVDMCAPCHSRRSLIDAPERPGRPFLDAHQPALLEAGLYHADGQIDGEVYVYGSFIQSKMFRAGVGCGDCHDPHALRIPEPVDAVCAKCHLPARFDTPAHHHHRSGSTGARCVECHMPAKRYMVIDDRRDHSFRVPRPDLSVQLGTPNACTTCHTDRPAEWAADVAATWWGPKLAARPTFARALDAGRRTAAAAIPLLVDLVADPSQPGIARATGLSLLGRYATPAARRAIAAGLKDSDPLVRMAAIEATVTFGNNAPFDDLFAVLADPRRAVRIEAARPLAPLLRSELPADRRKPLEHAIAEYRHAQKINGDRPEALVNLATLQVSLGHIQGAERLYRMAIGVGPYFLPAYVNLADLLREDGRDLEGEGLLQRALAVDPKAATVHLALGLLLVRTGRRDAALEHLRKAALEAPENPHFAYVYGVALHSTGHTPKALEVLRANHRRHDGHRDTLIALATISRDAGAREDALRYAEQLVALDPGDPIGSALLREMSSAQRVPRTRSNSRWSDGDAIAIPLRCVLP